MKKLLLGVLLLVAKTISYSATETIRNIFPKEFRTQIQPVVFSSGLQKVTQLKEAKISVFYGDVDADMT